MLKSFGASVGKRLSGDTTKLATIYNMGDIKYLCHKWLYFFVEPASSYKSLLWNSMLGALIVFRVRRQNDFRVVEIDSNAVML